MADAMLSSNTNPDLSMNISMDINNLMQIGDTTIPYTMSGSGVVPMLGFDRASGNAQEQRRILAFDAMMQNAGSNIFGDEYLRVKSRAEGLSSTISQALASVPDSTVLLPEDNNLAATLQTVGKMIASRNTLGMSRQIFFVGLGGWDTHADQLTRHPALLSTLSQALNYFSQVTDELALADKVTTFTAADFGRTLTSNGDGSDHGWGGHQLVMGGAVNGGEIYGQMPEIIIEGPQDSGRGRIIPTTSVDQYASTLASWYGLAPGDIVDIFPNLGNFSTPNLGFV